MRQLRLGFDMDGVLVNFSKRFSDIANKLTGKQVDYHKQSTWDFEEFTADEVDKAWEVIHTTPDFWMHLDPIEPPVFLSDLEDKHILYFITSRVYVPGHSIEYQSASWVLNYKRVVYPTVLVVPHWSQKAELIHALKLDAFIDDKPDTVNHLRSTGFNCYIYNQPYNQAVDAPRVSKILDYVTDVEAKLGRI